MEMLRARSLRSVKVPLHGLTGAPRLLCAGVRAGFPTGGSLKMTSSTKVFLRPLLAFPSPFTKVAEETNANNQLTAESESQMRLHRLRQDTLSVLELMEGFVNEGMTNQALFSSNKKFEEFRTKVAKLREDAAQVDPLSEQEARGLCDRVYNLFVQEAEPLREEMEEARAKLAREGLQRFPVVKALGFLRGLRTLALQTAALLQNAPGARTLSGEESLELLRSFTEKFSGYGGLDVLPGSEDWISLPDEVWMEKDLLGLKALIQSALDELIAFRIALKLALEKDREIGELREELAVELYMEQKTDWEAVDNIQADLDSKKGPETEDIKKLRELARSPGLLSLTGVEDRFLENESMERCVELELERDWSPSLPSGDPAPRLASGTELVELLAGMPLAALRLSMEPMEGVEVVDNIASSVARILEERASSASPARVSSSKELRFAEVLRAHRSGEKRFLVSPLGSYEEQQLPGVADAEKDALSSVRLLRSSLESSGEQEIVLRHAELRTVADTVLNEMFKCDWPKPLLGGERGIGKQTLLAQFAEQFCVALDRVLVLVESSEEVESTEKLDGSLRTTVCSPVPLLPELRKFVQTGQITEIFSEAGQALGWTTTLEGLSALKSLEPGLISLTVFHLNNIQGQALQGLIESLEEISDPAPSVGSAGPGLLAGLDSEASKTALECFKPVGWVDSWSPEQLRRLRALESADTAWLWALSESALEDARFLLGGSLTELRAASELLRDRARGAGFLERFYEHMRALEPDHLNGISWSRQGSAFLRARSVWTDLEAGERSEFHRKLSSVLLKPGTLKKLDYPDEPGLVDLEEPEDVEPEGVDQEDSDQENGRALRFSLARLGSQELELPDKRSRFQVKNAELGLSQELFRRMSSAEIEEVRPELRFFGRLARNALRAAQQTLEIPITDMDTDDIGDTHLDLENSSDDENFVELVKYFHSQHTKGSEPEGSSLLWVGEYAKGVSALLFLPRENSEELLQELFPPAELRSGLGLPAYASLEQCRARFCGAVFLEILTKESEARRSHKREFERLADSAEWKKGFGKLRPLRLCFATREAAESFFRPEGLSDLERAQLLASFFVRADLASVAGVEQQWQAQIELEETEERREAWRAIVQAKRN